VGMVGDPFSRTASALALKNGPWKKAPYPKSLAHCHHLLFHLQKR